MIQSFFSLRKSKRVLRQVHRLYGRKAGSLDQYTKESIQAYLKSLQGAILEGNHGEAKRISRELEQAALRLMPKSSFDKARDFVGGIVFALLIAITSPTTHHFAAQSADAIQSQSRHRLIHLVEDHGTKEPILGWIRSLCLAVKADEGDMLNPIHAPEVSNLFSLCIDPVDLAAIKVDRIAWLADQSFYELFLSWEEIKVDRVDIADVHIAAVEYEDGTPLNQPWIKIQMRIL